MSRRLAYPVVAAVAASLRLGVLLHERGSIVTAFTEKSDRFATTFVHHGTFGFVPGEPSAYTQPLYGWFLVPVYELFGRSWESVGLTQIGVAAVTALLVFELCGRFLAPRAALVAALIATANPYLVWHDVHVNREILDQLLAASVVLATLLAAERRSLRLAALVGVLCGIAMLGNTRLALLPVLVAAYLVVRLGLVRRALAAAALVLVLAVLAVTPWLVRNRIEVGCLTLTTDARALWKANNVNTYRTLAAGLWIDHVPRLSGAPAYTPEAAGDVWLRTGRVLHVDECAQMRLYRTQVIRFWEHRPGEKAQLVRVAVGMLWDPRASETAQRPGEGTRLDTLRRWLEGGWMSVLYALALVGVAVVPRAVAALFLLLLAYQTAAAAVFAGTTRYRVPWDFLIAALATAAVAFGFERLRTMRASEAGRLEHSVGPGVD